MAVGGGHLPVALAGLGVGGLAAFVVRPWRSAPPAEWVLTVRVGVGQSPEAVLEGAFARHVLKARPVGSATGRQGAALDLTYKLRLRPGVNPATLVSELNQVEGVQSVELRQP
jgi:hypothetical protein